MWSKCCIYSAYSKVSYLILTLLCFYVCYFCVSCATTGNTTYKESALQEQQDTPINLDEENAQSLLRILVKQIEEANTLEQTAKLQEITQKLLLKYKQENIEINEDSLKSCLNIVLLAQEGFDLSIKFCSEDNIIQDFDEAQTKASLNYIEASKRFSYLSDKTEEEKLKLQGNDSLSKALLDLCSRLKESYAENTYTAIINAVCRSIDSGIFLYENNKNMYEEALSFIPLDKEQEQYPKKASVILQNCLNNINLSLKLLDESNNACIKAINELSNINDGFITKRVYDSIYLITELQGLTTKLADTARVQQRSALTARNEVLLYYRQSKTAYEAGYNERAQNLLDRALSAYDNAITTIRLDTETQNEVYSQIAELRQKIAETQRPLIIKEMRQFKTEARQAYFAGNFEEADNILTQAEKRLESWTLFMDIEAEKDEELERLRGMVNTALRIESGRTLNPNNALYPEMSQLLTIANQYYITGSALIKNNKRAEGEKILQTAKEKLNDLRVVYPHNQEANLLSMKIDQILNPKQFSQTFSTKIEELKKVNYSKQDTTALTAYSDLRDLYEIEPNYKDLQAFIEQVEIDLGIRQPPIADSSAEEAQALAEQAMEIVQNTGRDALQLESAKTLAYRSIAIDPNNELAVQVLDEIALRTGTQSAVVLSAADEARYQQAITSLQSGNIVFAAAILQDLLQNPANRRSAKIRKLQGRIEGLLQ